VSYDIPVAACAISSRASVCVHFAKIPTPAYVRPKPTRGTSSTTRPRITSHSTADMKLYRMRYCVFGDLDRRGLRAGFCSSSEGERGPVFSRIVDVSIVEWKPKGGTDSFEREERKGKECRFSYIPPMTAGLIG